MSDIARPPVQLRPDVLAVPGYRQGAVPSTSGYKLSSNENPFAPQEAVLRALQKYETLNRYASPAMPELRATLAADFGVPSDHVHLGAGSVAILYQLVQAAAGPGESYVFAWPSFEAYPALGLASRAEAIRVPLTAAAGHDLDAMADAVTPQTRAILLCTPNNPTGPVITRSEFQRFMQRVPATMLVVLDEAYREFVTEPDAVRGEEELRHYPNLVVLRTMSKAHGLAGLRIGYGVGDPAIFAAAASVAIPLSVTGVAEAAARASLTDAARAENAERIAVLCARRDELAAQLRALGVSVPAAQGNFVWLPHSEALDAESLGAALAAAGIYARVFANTGVRVSVGEAESVAVTVAAVREYRAAQKGNV